MRYADGGVTLNNALDNRANILLTLTLILVR